MTLNELKGELTLVRERRREIAAMVHPSQCKEEYIRLMHREREIEGEIEFRLRFEHWCNRYAKGCS